MENKKYIDATQAAELLRISRPHVYYLARTGKVPSYRPFVGKILFDEEQLLDLLKR